jgi:hypothetical protein
MYDPTIARWNGVDALAEKYAGWSPYNYVLNSPLIFVDPNGMDTYLALYGAGWIKPSQRGQHGDLGKGLEKSAQVAAEVMRQYENLKEGDQVVMLFTPTENDFLAAVNKEYESGKIKELVAYSHGTSNSLSFGGPSNGSDSEDYRILSARDGGPTGEQEIKKISRENFTKDATITLWGCNLGGENEADAKRYASFAGYLAVHMGRGRKVYAPVGGGGQEFKQDSQGNNIYDGTMIPSANRASQKTNMRLFTYEEFMEYYNNKK